MQLDEIPSVSKDVFHACNNIKAWIDHRELETPIYGLSLFKVHMGQVIFIFDSPFVLVIRKLSSFILISYA